MQHSVPDKALPHPCVKLSSGFPVSIRVCPVPGDQPESPGGSLCRGTSTIGAPGQARVAQAFPSYTDTREGCNYLSLGKKGFMREP